MVFIETRCKIQRVAVFFTIYLLFYQENALDILKALKQIPINLETLQKTRIGMSVNNVRKQTTNEDVASMAKQLIKGWKKLVSGDVVKKKIAFYKTFSKKTTLCIA